MSWILYSALMYFFSVSLYLALRKLQKQDVLGIVNNTVMFGGGAFVFIGLALANGENLALEWQFILALFVMTFLFSYLGNRFSLEGIKRADNPGFSLIIQKSYAIYTTLAAVVLFNSEVTVKSLLAIVLVIGFMVLMLWPQKQKDDHKPDISWIALSFLAFFAFGNLALASKWLLDLGVSPLARTFYVQVFVSLMFLVDLVSQARRDKAVVLQLRNKANYFWFAAIALSNALFNLFMQYAFQIAPNVGYVNIINAGSISAITLLAALIYKEQLTMRKIVGVIGITVGIILLLI